jgi:ATP-binding cassette subfamily B protein
MPFLHRASGNPARFLLHYIRRRWHGHAVVLAAIVAAVGCAVGSQYGVKHLVDVLDSQHPGDLALWSAVAVLLVLVAGDNLLWRLAGWFAARTFAEVGGDIRLDLFQHLAGHGARYFSDRLPGALAGRVTTAAEATSIIETSLAWRTVPPGLAVICSIVVLGALNVRMTLALAAAVALLSIVIGRLAARGHPLRERAAERAAAVTGDIADVIGNIGLVRAFGSAQREQHRLARRIGLETTMQWKSLHVLERLRVLHAVSVFLVTAGVLVWSLMLWRQGRASVGDIVLATTLGFTVLHASRDFAMAVVDLLQHFARLGEAIRELGLPHEIVNEPDAQPLMQLGGSVSLVNVRFAYPGGAPVLHDITLHIPAGQKVGLVGRSGAGKTTILALLQRLYDPDAGHVLIDEQNIARITQESLHRSLAVVTQEMLLFHRSVRENLRYGRPDAGDAEIRRAAEAARCLEFIERMPRGFDTLVGERGIKVSGGQRQRLAIARALLRDAPILLLDEATSALDSDSERAIQEALARIVQGRTVIAVAHRLSTLESFDRIVVLDEGRIVEDGSPADLMRRQGHYSHMLRQQQAVRARA